VEFDTKGLVTQLVYMATNQIDIKFGQTIKTSILSRERYTTVENNHFIYLLILKDRKLLKQSLLDV